MMRPVDPLKANPTLRFPTDVLGYWQFAGVRPAAQVCQNVLSVPVRRQTLGLRMAEGDTVFPSLLSSLSRTPPRPLSVRVANHPTPCAWPTPRWPRLKIALCKWLRPTAPHRISMSATPYV